MKNLLLFSVLTILGIGACKDDAKDISPSIEGIWFRDGGLLEGTDTAYREELIFNNDGTFVRSLHLVDADHVNDIIGYLNLTKGNYKVSDGNLRRFDVSMYGLDNFNPFLDHDKLILMSTVDELPHVKIKINKKGETLTLEYTCQDDLLMCIPSETFYRQIEAKFL